MQRPTIRVTAFPGFFTAAIAALAMQAPPLAEAAVPTPDHVVVVILENHPYSSIIGNGAAPYINGLAASGALFTDSHGVTHPSEPNYLWLFSGSNQGVTNDNCPFSFTTDNLAKALFDNAWTFATYSEDLPAEGSTVCSSGKYARKHNPVVNFTNVASSANKPFSAFPADFTTLPTVSWVVPNLDNDMHDGTIAAGDAWVQANVDAYVQWAATHNSLLILTFDEDDGSAGNQIVTIFVGPMVLGGSYAETIDHRNILRTIEDMYGVPYAGSSGSYSPITDAWNTCGDGTADPGEQCGEPGLSCGPDLVCQACSCVNTSICASGIAPDSAALTMVANPFAMTLKASAVIPKPWAGVDPPTSGIRIVVDGLTGSNGLDVTLPGGAAWTANSAGTRWRYTDRSGSVSGITRVVLTDQSARSDGLLKLAVKGKGGVATLPNPSEARLAIVFGAADECASSGFASLGAACSGDASAIRCK